MIWNSKKIKKEDKMIKHYLTVFLISMVPIAELRAAIPYSQAVNKMIKEINAFQA